MKNLFKKIIYTILKWEAVLVLKRFKPRIIGVAGSVGKTSTKDAIYASLKDFVVIRKNQKSFNSEIGVPLTILGLETGWNNPMIWLKNIIQGFKVIFAKEYPEWLVLEMGTDHPGDMKKLISWISLDYAVFTRFPEIPVHAEYFKKADEVNEEDAHMMFGLKKEGVLVLNADDEKISELALKSTFKTIWYGAQAKKNGVAVSHMQVQYDQEKNPIAQQIKINFGSNSVPFTINGALGIQHVYPILAALVVAKDLGINVLDVLQSLNSYHVPVGRMNIIKGIDDITIIDDSYNSSPIAVEVAIQTLASIDAQTRIAVLGDMAELGKYTQSEHKKIAHILKENKINHLITFGEKAEYIREEAEDLGIKKICNALSHIDASQKVLEWAKGKTVVLIKGSQSARMEKVSYELLKDKSDAYRVLVRQDVDWKKR
jgi:UDP-N-acetylmuramoyl-tripeptide--D-alanyl-D-alanine ligase